MQVLKQCGDDLTRENVMKEAANLKELKLDMLLPGISINTSPTDFYPIKQQQMIKFGRTLGANWASHEWRNRWIARRWKLDFHAPPDQSRSNGTPAHRFRGRFDVLVEPKEIGRIIFIL